MNNDLELGPPLGERNPVINSPSVMDFPTFIESTGLSEKDKDLIKGVFYDWMTQ